jgi:hypothetical protein
MKTPQYLLLCLALSLAIASAVRGQGPVSTRTEGQVLLLKNEHAIEGKIQGLNGQYRIERMGGELWLPADRALRLCANWQEAHAVMQSRANLEDPDERVRLAKWCHLNGLHALAVQEARAALVIRPGDSQARQLLTIAERAANQPDDSNPSTHDANSIPPPPSNDLSSDSVAMFVTKVQPILMNTCASCHSGDQGGSFKLYRTYGITTGNQRSTQNNVAAVLKQINLEKPEYSALLYKAASRHGPAAQAPLQRDSIPYRLLEEWVNMTLKSNPYLRVLPQLAAGGTAPAPVQQAVFASDNAPAANSGLAPFATNPPRPLPKSVTEAPLLADNSGGDQVPMVFGKPSVQPESVQPASITFPATAQPAPPEPRNVFAPAPKLEPAAGQPVDEFDPEIFNQQMFPGKK